MLIGVIGEELLIEFAFAVPLAEPLSALDMVDAGPGSLLVEAPTFADDIVDAGASYSVSITAVATAADLLSADVTVLITGDVSEPAAADAEQDATVTGVATAMIRDELSVVFVTPSPASVSVLMSGTMLTVQ